MEFKPKISVIIPIYNVEKYLGECLDSVLAQSFKDFEVICVDDGSTDKSTKILEEYQKKDNRIKILQQQRGGAGVARNLGLGHAQGKYVQFLDSDDYFEPNLLEEMYTRAEKYDVDLVVCSSKKVDDEGNIIESKNPNSPINLAKTPLDKIYNKNDFKEDFFSLLTPVPWNKLFKKDLIINNEIEFPNLHICEDIAFVHSYEAVAEKILVFDKELINYRFNRAGSMAYYRTKYTIDVVHSCNILKQFLIQKGLYKELESAFINAFKNHIRWEIALSSDEEYKKFLAEFKKLMPNDWMKFNSALRKDYITLDYLYRFIGEKKVLLWGASFFIQKLLAEERLRNQNILGIIDKNEASWGKICGNYRIYPPESLYELKPDAVLMTIWSNYEEAYSILKKELNEKYPEINLLPNIFEGEIIYD